MRSFRRIVGFEWRTEGAEIPLEEMQMQRGELLSRYAGRGKGGQAVRPLSDRKAARPCAVNRGKVS